MRARGRVHPRPGGRYTDWALFPHVQRFATVPDLLRDLLTADLYGISQNMRRNNEDALLGASPHDRELHAEIPHWTLHEFLSRLSVPSLGILKPFFARSQPFDTF